LSEFNLNRLRHLLEISTSLFLHQLDASVVSHWVVQKLGEVIIWFFVILVLVVVLLDGFGSDKRPNDCNNPWTDAAFSQELKLELLNTEDLIVFLASAEA